MIYRVSILTPIGRTLMLAIFASIGLGGVLAMFLEDPNMAIILGLGLTMLWIVFVWVYFLTLRLQIQSGCVTKSSLFRTTRFLLNENTQIFHRADAIALQGVNLTATFEGVLAEEMTTHIQIRIKNGSSHLKVGSAFKEIIAVRRQLVAFEGEVITPSGLKRVQLGEQIVLGPFRFHQGNVAFGRLHSVLPLSPGPEVRDGKLHFHISGKRRSIAMRKQPNLLTTLSLLGGCKQKAEPASEETDSAVFAQ